MGFSRGDVYKWDWTTSRDGHEASCTSVLGRQRKARLKDSLQPTFIVEMANGDGDNGDGDDNADDDHDVDNDDDKLGCLPRRKSDQDSW